MRTILAIETSTDVCAVAVAVDGRVVVEVALDRARRHAERLVPMIDDACALASVDPRRLDAVAVSAGPGSFTGLRIGVSTAKGIAFATGARLVPVPSLQALAGAAGGETGRLIIAAFAARRQEVFAAAYRADRSAAPPLVAGPVAMEAAEALRALVGSPAAAEGAAVRRILVPEAGPASRPGGAVPPMVVGDGADRFGPVTVRMPWIRPTAAAVARAGLELARRVPPVDPDLFEPYYLREFTSRPANR